MQTVYFDYNATTPLDPQIREAMLPFLGEVWGNPSSVHHVGRQARAQLDNARERAATKLCSRPGERRAPTWQSWALRGSLNPKADILSLRQSNMMQCSAAANI